MLMKTAARFAVILSLLVFVGCGDTNTNGTLTVTVPVVDNTSADVITPTAVYSNSTASSFSGVPITIVTTVHTLSGGSSQTFTANLSTDSTGTVAAGPYTIPKINEPLYVDVTATTGNLRSSQNVVVPSL